MLRALYLIFILSGAAGLMYESIWTRYLGLFVGHDAYAQIIVLVIFLGGMSAGALAISRRTERLSEPLYGYVAVEFVVGCIGLFFHEIYQAVTAWSYASVYPALAGSWALTAAKWSIAGALILPQSVLLGMTFPLMTAGAIRLGREAPGRSLSMLYFSNSLGAAVGVLLAGFYLVELAGLPGTLLVAAMVNLIVAIGTIFVIVAARNAGQREAREPEPRPAAVRSPAPVAGNAGLERLLLFTSLGTAVASFIYEIDWIRMLALVLGSATHSFELMLSAFILGLAFGALWIRERVDRIEDPVRTLGLVQWAMGCLALATLPLYVSSFDWIAVLLGTFARNDAGYTGFTIARYALCLAIMYPATFCAGMTLPLITRTLMVTGSGERAIGAVYAWNTLGSILGVALGGLVLLPLIGLKPMLIVGAAIDIGIGVLLLTRARPSAARGRLVAATAAGGVAFVALVGAGVRLDSNLLASGVYRTGSIIDPKDREITFHRDGRTATVTASRTAADSTISLATNGKPDASLTPIWFQRCDVNLPRTTLGRDAAAQTLLPLLSLAHAPEARTAAMIGQGSGMSSHLLLASPHLRELVTIEIEPEMVEGSRAFYPANRRVFDDPRSRVVIDDGKSFFASGQRKYDLIVSEPSNPWVSGVSGLFTTEFYARVREHLSPNGVFGQWMQVYELDDALVLSVIAALHQNFGSYEVFQLGHGDLLVVASNQARLPRPDWSVVQHPGLVEDLCRFLPLTPEALSGLHLAGRAELEPLMETLVQPNSDYYPVLDLGAERRRFRRDNAKGFPALSAEWFNLMASLTGRRTDGSTEMVAALPENPRVRARALGALLRSPSVIQTSDSVGPSGREAIYRWHVWRSTLAADRAPSSWEIWLDYAHVVERERNGGTAGVGDNEFFADLNRFMSRHRAPEAVRDVVQFRHALASWDFAKAEAAAARLLPVATKERRWITADELRDGLVIARLHLRDAAGARQALDTLARFSTRPPEDLRSRLLGAYVSKAEELQGKVASR